MAEDFVINVKQIAQYDRVTATAPTDRYLLQQNGVGGPYKSIAPTDLITTALENGGWLKLAPGSGIAWNGSALTSDGGNFSFTGDVQVPSLHSLGDIFVNNIALADQDWVTGLFDTLEQNVVFSVNGRKGNVQIESEDILRAGGILQWNPTFAGVVTVPTLWNPEQKDDSAASTAWVQSAICHWLMTSPLVQSFNGRTGPISLETQDVAQALFAHPFQARAPTPPPNDASTRIANTEFVDLAVDAAKQQVIIQMDADVQQVLDLLQLQYAPLASPQFTGMPQAPTAGPGTSTGQLATTAFVMNAVAESVAGVVSFNTRTGAVVFTAADLNNVGGALLASPIFTGTPSGPTATAGTNSTQLATTAFVAQAVANAAGVTSFNTRTGPVTLLLADVTGVGGAPISNAALTGAPTAPTPPLGDSSTRLATTAWVLNEVGAIASGVVSFNGRSGTVTLTAGDISGAGGAVLAGPAFTGIPTAPTAVPGTNTQQLATTAFVTAAMGAAQGVSSFNNRTGAVTLTLADITAAGGAPTVSPVFSSAPAAPTASPGTATVQIATTAFVAAALSGFLNSPAMTGTPTAPTAAVGTSSTQVATTAFVAAALGSISGAGVTTWNGRSGAVTLTWGDVSAVGAAPLAAPAFTGIPTAPTAAPGTSTQQLATTAFVTAALGGGGVVSSFNTRTGAVSLTLADVTGTGVLNNTALTGVPTAPTAAASTNTTQVASCAFVESELAAKGGGGPGNRVLLGSQTISSAVASVSFTQGINNTYDTFEFEIIGLGYGTAPSTVGLRGSTNGGSTWRSGNSDYGWAYNNASTSGYSGGGGGYIHMLFIDGTYIGPGYRDHAFIRLWRPWHTSIYPYAVWQTAQLWSDGNFYSLNGAGAFYFFGANALQLFAYQGTFNQGLIKLYGIQK